DTAEHCDIVSYAGRSFRGHADTPGMSGLSFGTLNASDDEADTAPAAGWRAVLLFGRATTSAAARSRHADPDPRCETSFCRYRYRSRRFQNWIWLTWRTPRLWCPLPASLAGGAGARPDHPISGRFGPAQLLGASIDPVIYSGCNLGWQCQAELCERRGANAERERSLFKWRIR